MKRLQQISMAVVLTLMLATGSFAGIIQTGVTSPEPSDPPPATAPDSTSAPATPSDQQNSAASSSPVVDLTLILLQSLLTVF